MANSLVLKLLLMHMIIRRTNQEIVLGVTSKAMKLYCRAGEGSSRSYNIIYKSQNNIQRLKQSQKTRRNRRYKKIIITSIKACI